jgi:hypothetical protein
MFNLSKEAPFIPTLRNPTEYGGWHINKFVVDEIQRHLTGLFSDPEHCAWREVDWNPESCTMAFHVVSYGLSLGPFESDSNDPSERLPTGRFYNDGPYIRLEVFSASDSQQSVCSAELMCLALFCVPCPRSLD